MDNIVVRYCYFVLFGGGFFIIIVCHDNKEGEWRKGADSKEVLAMSSMMEHRGR